MRRNRRVPGGLNPSATTRPNNELQRTLGFGTVARGRFGFCGFLPLCFLQHSGFVFPFLRFWVDNLHNLCNINFAPRRLPARREKTPHGAHRAQHLRSQGSRPGGSSVSWWTAFGGGPNALPSWAGRVPLATRVPSGCGTCGRTQAEDEAYAILLVLSRPLLQIVATGSHKIVNDRANRHIMLLRTRPILLPALKNLPPREKCELSGNGLPPCDRHPPVPRLRPRSGCPAAAETA